MIRQLRLRAARLWATHEPLYIELVAGLVTASWGLHVWLTAGLDNSPAYATVARWAPDRLWSAVGVAGGLLQVTAAALGNGRVRTMVACGLLAYWLLLSDGLRLSAPGAHGLVLYLGMAVFELVPAVRVPWRAHGR